MSNKETLLIIGSGFSGLYIANKYKSKYNVIVIDKNDHIGGQIKTYRGTTMSALINIPTKCTPMANLMKTLNLVPKYIDVKIQYNFSIYDKIAFLCFLIILILPFGLLEGKQRIIAYIIIMTIAFLILYDPRELKNNNPIKKYLVRKLVFPIMCLWGRGDTFETLLEFPDNYKITIPMIFYFISPLTSYGMTGEQWKMMINHLSKDLNDIRLNTEAIHLNKKNKTLTCNQNGKIYDIKYDKCVICHNITTAKYIDISKIIRNDIKDLIPFYSTYIQVNGEIQKNLPYYVKGHFKADKGIYVISSYVEPNIAHFDNVIDFKVCKWNMSNGYLTKEDNKAIDNALNRYDIYSVGEHQSGLGVPYNLNNAENLVIF